MTIADFISFGFPLVTALGGFGLGYITGRRSKRWPS